MKFITLTPSNGSAAFKVADNRLGKVYTHLTGSKVHYINGHGDEEIITANETPDTIANAVNAAPTFSYDPAVTAKAGGNQASGYVITADVTRLAVVASDEDSVTLPAAVPGMRKVIQNRGANEADCYPATGEKFEGQSANAAMDIPSGNDLEVICYIAGVWTY